MNHDSVRDSEVHVTATALDTLVWGTHVASLRSATNLGHIHQRAASHDNKTGYYLKFQLIYCRFLYIFDFASFI